MHTGMLGNMQIPMDAPNYGGTETSPSQNVPSNGRFDFKTKRA